MKSFLSPYGLSNSGEEKFQFTPYANWRRDEALIPPLRRVVAFRARYGWETAHRFGGWAKFEERATDGWGKIVLHTCSDLWLRTIQWPCTLVSQCHFLHFRTLLFFSLTYYPGEIAYFNSPNRQLSNGAWVMELFWNRNVDPSRSPCLKTVHRKSFEHGNFLMLRPILLKNAYFNSANRQLSIDIRHVELRQRKIVDPSIGAP